MISVARGTGPKKPYPSWIKVLDKGIGPKQNHYPHFHGVDNGIGRVAPRENKTLIQGFSRARDNNKRASTASYKLAVLISPSFVYRQKKDYSWLASASYGLAGWLAGQPASASHRLAGWLAPASYRLASRLAGPRDRTASLKAIPFSLSMREKGTERSLAGIASISWQAAISSDRPNDSTIVAGFPLRHRYRDGVSKIPHRFNLGGFCERAGMERPAWGRNAPRLNCRRKKRGVLHQITPSIFGCKPVARGTGKIRR